MKQSRRRFITRTAGFLVALQANAHAQSKGGFMPHDLKAPPVSASFARIMAWADGHVPLLRASLRQGANLKELERLEAQAGYPLPNDLRDLYLLADGQIIANYRPSEEEMKRLERAMLETLPESKRRRYTNTEGSLDLDRLAEDEFEIPTPPGLFLGSPLNPLQTVMYEWSATSLAPANDVPDVFPPNTIKPAYYNAGWIPITDDGGGNFLAVDLDPGPAGISGQIIIYGSDERPLLRVAPSLDVFLHWVAGEMETGHFGPARPEARTLSPADAKALAADRAIAVSEPPSINDWRWRNNSHLHDGLRKFIMAGGKIE